MLVNFSPELVAVVVGTFLSVLFGWFPGLRVKFAALESAVKSGIMLLALVVTSVTIYLLAFFGVITTSEPVTIVRLLTVLVVAVIQNQTTFNIVPEAKDVIAIKQMIKAQKLSAVSNVKPDTQAEQ